MQKLNEKNVTALATALSNSFVNTNITYNEDSKGYVVLFHCNHIFPRKLDLKQVPCQ